MDILSVNADQKLAHVASSIGRDPMSWQGWYALVISVNDTEKDLMQECLFWTKSIVESYLSEAEGRLYFCAERGIHILCKTPTKDVLEQTGRQICELVHVESSVRPTFELYDLSAFGFMYTKSVLENTSNIFSLPEAYNETPLAPEKKGIAAKLQTAMQKPQPESQGDRKVLLVEDDPVTRWMVRNALKDECEFATAQCGNKAFSMYSSFEPDVVFLDINLPDKNGYEILEWIMRNDPGACVVMFSSNSGLDNIAHALEDGASGFIAKPFLKENLLHYINHRGEG